MTHEIWTPHGYQTVPGFPDECEGRDDPEERCPRHPRDCVCAPPPPKDWDNPRSAKPTAFELSQRKQTTSADRLFGKSVVFGKENGVETPYMTRYWFGRLRLHIFHRGDADPDCHDHPWSFWTFPFVSYVEEVVVQINGAPTNGIPPYLRRLRVVPAWRLTFRPATHTHRVIGRYSGFGKVGKLNLPYKASVVNRVKGVTPIAIPGPMVTLVWRTRDQRKWGFLKERDGRWCWIAWREYVFGGGKNAPCE